MTRTSENVVVAPFVAAVHRSGSYCLSKSTVDGIELVAGLGVAGDIHAGATVRHRSRVARDPAQPNLRQVHLIQGELHDELVAAGFAVGPGAMGENITTRGIDLLALPRGSRLHVGEDAVIEVTGLRNPCAQLDGLFPGLMAAVLDRDPDGRLVRRAGVMGVVRLGGRVTPADAIVAVAPDGPCQPLEPV
jgi:hypothetical protein